MAVSIPGLSTLGVRLGYAVETVAGQKPAAFKWLERANNIGGIELPSEQIDASALEDFVTRYVAGRQDSGGEWTVTFNITPEVVAQLEAMIAEYNTGSASSLNTWFEVWSPNNASAFYVVAQPPQILPMPEFGQNELQTIDVVLTIVEYKGQSAAIQPTEMVAITLSDSAVSVAESASKTVTATTVPAGQTVTWASANTSVATVANGVITGVSAGTTTVTASFTTSAGTATASVAVTVTD